MPGKATELFFHFDSPCGNYFHPFDKIVISGWFVHASSRILSIELCVNDTLPKSINFPIKREDVQKALPHLNYSLDSGFFYEISFHDIGRYDIAYIITLDDNKTQKIPYKSIVVNDSGFHFSLDEPDDSRILSNSDELLRGWIFHEKSIIDKIYINIANWCFEPECRLKRDDVFSAFPLFADSLYSGFRGFVRIDSPQIYNYCFDVVFTDKTHAKFYPPQVSIEVLANKYRRLEVIINEDDKISYKLYRGFDACRQADATVSVNDAPSGQDFFLENFLLKHTNHGVNIIGFFDYCIGISDVGRMFISAITKSNIPFTIKPLKSVIHPRISDEELSTLKNYYTNELVFNSNINFTDVESISNIPKIMGYKKNSFNYQVFWWEYDSGLEDIQDCFNLVDNVIIYTDFIKHTLKAHGFKNKITKMLLPYVPPANSLIKPQAIVRAKLGIPINRYIFMFSFDYHSSFDRKNPIGVINAFKNVVSVCPGSFLVIKTTNAERYPLNRASLQQYIQRNNLNDSVKVIDNYFSKNEYYELINSIDCFVSLHRGEGLGLNLLDAMSLRKPVVATGFGGNIEFMNKQNSFIVDFTLSKSNDRCKNYKNVKRWAEPSIEHATEIMRDLVNNPDKGVEIGDKAKSFIENKYSIKNVVFELNDVFKNIK